MKHSKGFTLLSAISGVLVASIAMAAMTQLMLHLNNSGRGIASNGDLLALSQLANLLLDGNACPKTGLVGVNIVPLLGPTPVPVPVSLHLPGSPTTPVLEAGVVSGTRRVVSVALTDAKPIGPAGGNLYLATLTTTTSIQGVATSHRNPNWKNHLVLSTDGGSTSNTITNCYNSPGGSPNPPTLNAQCPDGQRLQAINPDGTAVCKPAYNMMGGYFMVSSSQFVSSIIDNPTGATSTTYTNSGAPQTLYFGNCGVNTYTNRCSCPAGFSPIVLFQQTFRCDPADPFYKNYCTYHYPTTDPVGTGSWKTGWLVNALTILCTNGAGS